jgi:glycosyltransferase involved in cell wall biosynthesis
MRVVHVVTAFPRHPGDVITPWMVELVRRSRQRGIDAEVLAPAYRGDGAREVEGIPVRRFRYAPSAWETLTHDETVPDRIRRQPAFAGLVPLYLAGGAAASLDLGRHRPDLVHVHWPMPHALFGAAARWASGGRCALVCSFYSVELNWVSRRMRWLLPFLRWSARTADQVTAISHPTADLVRRITGVEALVVPFAAAVGEPADGGDGAPRPPLSGDPGEPLELLFVGRLVERKGVEVLVRALPAVLRHRPARLTVVGEGEWEPMIREAIREAGVREHVQLTGYVSGDTLSRLYREADLFVLPAVVDRKGDTEGLGVVLLEAMRQGRPVLASRVGGIPDIVVHERSGWLVPPGDPDALAEAILAAAADPERTRTVAREGRRRAVEDFSWERVLDGLEGAYEAALAHRSGRAGRDGTPGKAGAGG